MRHLPLAFALALTPLTAVTARAEAPVTSFELENGMQVVVIEDHRAPVVEHMVWYRAGSADEQPGVSGVAHFLEHLLFKGTEKLDPGEFSKVVAANGGSDNAFTSFDQTAYHQRVAADRLDLMMEMESDRMVNLQLGEADILTERDVIIEERNMRVENDPRGLFREQLQAALYLNHPYGTPIIGWRHEMEALDLDAALDFYRQYYAPNNAILIVAGDVTPDEVRRLADKYYAPIPPNPDLKPRARPSEPRQMAERRLNFRDARVSTPYVNRMYLAPERDPGAQEQGAALTILAEILGGGQTSVLNQALQFDQKKAVYTSAYYNGSSLDDGSFGLFVVPAPGVTLEDAETAMNEVVAKFMVEGVDPAQLERIKFQMKASQIYAQDNVSGLARRYGDALTSGLTIEDVQAWPEILQAVTAEDVMAAAEMIFDRDKSVTGYLMPAEEVTQ
ncbi:insulinase family protein [Sagittula sp. NFXS13]|uniref:M16 family metallopeptidase n=1 Tax=Sagittula sp. NFXS13 TaxID=2819095 RepID=UPI0032DFBFC5